MPLRERPLAPAWSPGLRHSPPFRRASTSRQLECPCGIFLSGLVFENVRQRVGCVSVCSPSEMSIAVEHERSLLTAERLRNHTIPVITGEFKPCLLGGNS